MPTYYEWRVEEETGDGGDIELEFFDNYADAVETQKESPGTREICLVRRKVEDGWTLENWAFIEDGKLPEFFDDCPKTNAHKVPAKFHKEAADFSK